MAKLRHIVETADLPETLTELLERCVASSGDAPAAVWFDDGITLTYRELNRLVSTFAAALSRRGIRKGNHVSVMLPNSPASLICWFGLARLGAVIVPVNIAYTPEEAAFVIRDSNAVALVVHDELLHTVAQIKGASIDDSFVFVYGDKETAPTPYVAWNCLFVDSVDSFEPEYPVCRHDLLNIQYTSGSTGFPKGCMLTHDYWLIAGKTMAEARGREPDLKQQRILIWPPFYYLDPMWQLVATLYLGATAYIARRMQLSKFLSWIEDYQIDTCWAFPELLSKQPDFLSKDESFPLRYTSISMWTPEARQRFDGRTRAIGREAFGMTEVGLNLIVPRDAGDYAFTKSCGLAGPFRDHIVVDENGEEVPDGQEGELCVSGRSIMLGYYNRPGANADTFRGKWLRTGDKVYHDAHGYYYVVGRIKDMIKRSGENIAAIEVEGVLRTMDEIEEAAVLAVPDPLRREEVKAYVRLREGLTRDQVTPAQIVAHCAKRLAAFKLPRYIAYVEEFPRTPSRKIAKRVMKESATDLQKDAFDVVEGIWR